MEASSDLLKISQKPLALRNRGGAIVGKQLALVTRKVLHYFAQISLFGLEARHGLNRLARITEG